MGEPWLDDASFKQERPDMSADSGERYQSSQRIAEGVVAELYDAVPTKFLQMLQNENHFKDVVSLFIFLFLFSQTDTNPQVYSPGQPTAILNGSAC
jgi:hypothetical protein